MISTVDGERICAPVVGDVPSFRSIARISNACQTLIIDHTKGERAVLTGIFSGLCKAPGSPAVEEAR
jgi:hypothetical protein